MAYGRDAQAEEILLDALKNEPTRHAIHVKLLEIYAQRKSQKQFETLASELYAQTSGVGAEWEKAAAMGRKLDPANPLYGSKGSPDAPAPAAALGVGAAGAVAAVASGVAGIAAAAETPHPFKDTWTMPGELKAAAGEGADDETTVAMPRAAIPADAATGSFDLNLPPLEGSSDAKPAPEAQAADLDFDLGLDFSAPPSSSPATSEVVRTGVLEPGIAERSEAAAAFAAEAAAAERANREEAFAGTESMVARSIIDFDLGDAAESLPKTKPAAAKPDVPVMDLERTDVAGTLIDFNLDELTGSKPSGDVAVMDLERTDVGGNLLDFNFELEGGKQAQSQVQDSVPTLDLSSINLDLPVPEGGADSPSGAGADGENPEAATKLELAKAYEEMGDRDGARELLDEVLAEGSVAQRDIARDILARLS
jgi:pilus assembly protein FimV